MNSLLLSKGIILSETVQSIMDEVRRTIYDLRGKVRMLQNTCSVGTIRR